MIEDAVLYTVADGVATITLNRPRQRNALLPEMTDRMAELVGCAEADDAVRVIVLTGAEGAFSSGADVKMMGRSDRLGRTALVGRARNLHGASITRRLLDRQKPMIAAIHGVVAGQACAFALACDFAVAATTARFIFSFVRVGFIPDSGTTYLLTRRVGLANAQRIALTGEPVPADEALRLGLVTEVVADDAFPGRVAALAQSIASQPPHAVRLTRQLLWQATTSDYAAATHAEALAQGILGETEDHKEAVRAFAEKRTPTFVGK